MGWQILNIATWLEKVHDLAEAQPDEIAGLIRQMQLVPPGYDDDAFKVVWHDGPLTLADDFTPPGLITAIDGDLTLSGKVTTEGIDGADGNATLVVLGDLRCGSLVNDWASIIIVTGDCIVDDWVFAAREDSSLIVGGAFRTPIFIGADIWAAVGGAVDIETGDGYAVALRHAANAYGAPQIRPRRDWRDLVSRLALDRGGAVDEYDLVMKIEDRLYQTGTILPQDQ